MNRSECAVWALICIGCALIILANLPTENPAGFLIVAVVAAAAGLVSVWGAIIRR